MLTSRQLFSSVAFPLSTHFIPNVANANQISFVCGCSEEKPPCSFILPSIDEVVPFILCTYSARVRH